MKKYLGKFLGLYRVEVIFNSIQEEKEYIKENMNNILKKFIEACEKNIKKE